MEKRHYFRSLGIAFGLSVMAVTVVLGQQQGNLSNSTRSQELDEPPVDGYFVKSDIQDRKVIEYAPIRPADVAYVKRVWQEFDLRERANAIYASPKANLMQIIMEAVLAGELTAYDPTPSPEDPTGDSFKKILPADQVMGRFGGDSTLVEQYDDEGNVISSQFVAATFNPNDVVRFRIKEDWIFDRRRSVFEPRIVGIAPLVTPKMDGMGSQPAIGQEGDFGDLPFDTGSVAPTMEADPYPAFWIYFPEARYIFVNKEVPSRYNDTGNLSFDDVFIRRLFSSYIVKESNPEDLRIKDYISNGVERLYEAERIKNGLVNFEQDLWSY